MKTPKGEINDKLFELIKDEATLEKMSACKSPEECYEIVKEKIEIDFDDFKESMTIAYSYLQESESGLLTDDELDQVAGGKSDGAAAATYAVTGLGGLVVGAGIVTAAMVGAAA